MSERQLNDIETTERQNLRIAAHVASDYFKGDKDLSIAVLGSGSCNINYVIEKEGRKIVVKLSKPYREYKALAEYKKEEWCLKKAGELGIPAPKVFAVGELEARAYMVQSYSEGIPAAALDGASTLSASEQLKVWQKLGEYAQKVHTVSVKGWGENMIKDGAFDGSWDKHLQYNIDSLCESDTLIEMSVLSVKESIEVKGRFEMLKGKELAFGLCHGDIALRNAIVDDQWQVSLLDWGTARAEIVPHYDLIEILRDSKPDDVALGVFLGGYGMSEAAFEAMKPDLHTLDLLRAVDTLRWAMDRMPDVVPEHIKTVRRVISSAI